MKDRKNTFKPYQQNQYMALPPSLDELIADNHPVRIVNHVIDEIDIDSLVKKYQGGGCSSYHPRMLLKVLIYGYLNNIYSSRKLERAVREDINFMWLAAMARPEHNTINRFRSERLNGEIKKIFSQVVLFMADKGLVDLQMAYTDGTIMEANANRYSFVWGKNVTRYREGILKKLEELWNYTQEVAAQELQDITPTSFEHISAEEVKQLVDTIDKALKDKPKDTKIKRHLSDAKNTWPDKLAGYEKQKQILGSRNSYSKTDTDATFMRMKEDHLQNSQLKPAYNVQISTNNQIITNYSVHQNPGDTTTLKPHLEQFEQHYGFLPSVLVADAGYGSEENYEYLFDDNKIEAYVKYNWFDKEIKQSHKDKKGEFHVDNLFYNPRHDCYYCPMGQQMTLKEIKKEKTLTGYIKTLHIYQAQNCNGCPMRGVCHNAEGHRMVRTSHKLRRLKEHAKSLLLSPKGIFHRQKRPVDIEPVFGFIKHNRGFRRFLLRGIEKVNIEVGVLCIVNNILKIVKLMSNLPDLDKLLSNFCVSLKKSRVFCHIFEIGCFFAKKICAWPKFHRIGVLGFDTPSYNCQFLPDFINHFNGNI